MPDAIPPDAHAIIIGAMKCGTTSLYNYLQEHPEICPGIVKEPEFFSTQQSHRYAVERYSDLFSFDDSKHKFTLDASTGYTKYPTESGVAQRIFAYGLRPKLIYIIRNPFERIVSHFNFMQSVDKWSLSIDSDYLIRLSDYHLQLEQYRRCFPREDLLLLDFDELKRHPGQVLERVYEFLNLSRAHLPATFEAANVTRPESALAQSIRRSKFGTMLSLVPQPLKRLGKSVLQKVVPPVKRTLTDREKEVIHRELKDGMTRLRDEYGFDVSHWGFNG